MEERKTILSVENLSIAFTQYERGFRFCQTKLPVIRNLNVTVREGELVAVVGSSGSGKSLLAHGVLGLLPYNADWDGKIEYDGESLTEKKLQQVRGHEIVFVPQSVSYLDPLMKVGSMMRRGSKREEDGMRSLQALERFGLGRETQELYPFELSGGMTKRVLIASAVMESPRLVIADEPTPGLHLEAAKRVLSHFREIADGTSSSIKSGKTSVGAGVLLITHDLELALTCADRIVVFYAGTNVEEALASDFAREDLLRHPYTKALYRAMPQHGFQNIAGVQPYVKNMEEGCLFAPRCSFVNAECGNDIPYKSLRGGKVRCVRAE